jgi:hypothetical protein
LEVSTIFLSPKDGWPNPQIFPPDNYTLWSDGCKSLQDLSGLHSLRFNIIVWDFLHSNRKDHTLVNHDSLLSILEPLQGIKAPLYEVEMNLPIPEAVQTVLGETSFTLVVKERPYIERLFII